MAEDLTRLLKQIRACRVCIDLPKAKRLPHEPRPVLQVSSKAKLAIFGQAPGTRVHESGKPFTDPSGDRLRSWMGIEEEDFYNPDKLAIIPMGFCFPGLDAKGGDLPPRKECATEWRQPLMEVLPKLETIILVGGYAQKWHLGKDAKKTLTETVASWRDYGPRYFPTPHPSWRNNIWLKKNPWFEAEMLPVLKERIAVALS